VVTEADGGGRIDAGAGNLELRGKAIAVGQEDDFLSAIGANAGSTPIDATAAGSAFVAQPVSTLYRARQLYADPILIRAGTLKVSYSTYALFQNTGLPGLNAGVVLGGTTGAPISNALQLNAASSSAANAFALFGTINGVDGVATALLGSTVIKLDGPVSLGDSRLNGCVIGAATACLSSSISEPPLNVFDNSNIQVISAVAPDLSFDSVLSSNNEALFSDIATPVSATEEKCTAADAEAGKCPPKGNPQ